jgi:hypothetical protein
VVYRGGAAIFRTTTFCAEAAAGAGRLDVLDYLFTQCSVRLASYCYDGACHNGHLDVVKWLHARGCAFLEQTVRSACAGGIEMLDWLLQHKAPLTEACLTSAAFACKPDVFRWLHAHGVRVSPDVLHDLFDGPGMIVCKQQLRPGRGAECFPGSWLAAAASSGSSHCSRGRCSTCCPMARGPADSWRCRSDGSPVAVA